MRLDAYYFGKKYLKREAGWWVKKDNKESIRRGNLWNASRRESRGSR